MFRTSLRQAISILASIALSTPLLAATSRAIPAKHTRQIPNVINGVPTPVVFADIQKVAFAGAPGKAPVSATGDRPDTGPSQTKTWATYERHTKFAQSRTPSHASPGLNSQSSNSSLATANFPGVSLTPSVRGVAASEFAPVNATVSADVNKDGKQDLVVVDSDGSINVLLNPGTGNFNDWKISSTNSTAVLNPSVYYANAQAIDLNGDGYPDIAALDLANNAEFVYINNHNGGFADPVEYDVNFSSGAVFNNGGGDVLTADINGDGVADMIAVGYYHYQDENYQYQTTISLLVRLGNGDGSFAAPLPELTQNFPGVVSTHYGQLTLGDFNGDGKADLVINFNGYDNNYLSGCFLQVMLGVGDGTFSTPLPTAFPAGSQTKPYRIDVSFGSHIATDVDGDGHLDVLFSPTAGAGLWLAKGNGDGTLQDPTELSSLLGTYLNGGAQRVNFADINGDGQLDAIGYHDGVLIVLVNQGKGVFSTSAIQRIAGMGGVTQPLPADFNNDGIPDLVSVDGSSGRVGFYAGTGKANFTGVPALAPPAESAISVGVIASDDFNGDGALDTIVQDGNNSSETVSSPNIKLGLNDGKGNFNYTTLFTPDDYVGANQMFPQTADLNGDGKPDMLFNGYEQTGFGRTLMIAASKGDGTYASPVVVPLGVTLSCLINSIDIGDLNGDGYPDVVAAYPGDGNCNAYQPGDQPSGFFVLLNDGKGNFTPTFTPWGYGSDIVKLADLNGDGKFDLVISDWNDPYAYYYLYDIAGKGDGSFDPANAQYLLEYTAVSSIIPGDFDGDGIEDLAIGVEAQLDANVNIVGGTTGVYIMKGNGDFTFHVPVIYDVGVYPVNGKFADMNGDGLPDLVMDVVPLSGYTDNYTPHLAMLQNMGNGAFAPSTQGFSSPTYNGSGSLFVGDYNGDGAPDVLLGTNSLGGGGLNFITLSELALNQGGDALTLTPSSTQAIQNTPVTLTATVTSTVRSETPSGTVSFFNNGNLLGALPLSNGIAVMTLGSLSVGNNQLTASYSGDTNFNAVNKSAGVNVSVTALLGDFTLSTASPASLSLAQGQSGSVQVGLAANATFNGSVSLSCSGQPSESACSVYPSTVSLTNGQSTMLSVVLVTTPPNNQNSAANHMATPMGGAGTLAMAGLFICVIPSKRRRSLYAIFMLAASFGLALTSIGCSSSYKYPGTTVGMSNITVTAQSGTISKVVKIPVTITR